MTHQNHQTNGASLEDCHTNFFALTELYGIKWRKLVWGETSGGGEGEEGAAPLADPVISSYARCLAGDILCVWRRVPSPQSSDIYDMSPLAPPPLSLRAAKELWIFWYGEEPDLNGLVAPELIASQGDQGSWELGLSYECRSLLFKALHNLIERCLLSRDFVRLGKWFVQPYDGDEEDVGKSPWHLSFSFAFFLHGESTVCASVDVRQHPPVRTLPRRNHHNNHHQKVILAPFGLEGTLTGREWNDSDAATARLLEAWRQLYPLEQGCGAVEVICGGVRMRYPVPYALVTEMEARGAPPPQAAVLAARTLHALTTPAPINQHGEGCYNDSSGEKLEDFIDPIRKTVCSCAKWRRRRAPRPPRPPPFHRRAPPAPPAPRHATPAPRRATPAAPPHPRHTAGCGGASSPGSCGGGSPAPPASAPSSAGAPPASPHHAGAHHNQPSTVVPPSLHTPAPTPDPHAPPTPAPPSAPTAKLYNQGDSPPSGATNGPTNQTDPFPAELMKRPQLPVAERRADPLEDEHSLHMLYDYSTVYAWLEHPVKRFKAEESWFREELALGASGAHDLYAGHDHTVPAALLPDLDHVKHEKNEHEDIKEYKNLFTSDGLCPSVKDLDQIFDNSDDAASGDETVRLLVQTPPDSNKSVEEARYVGRCVRAEELSKMFPTPPSMEPHTQPSPGFTLDDAPAALHHHHHHHHHLTRLAQPGSPPPDPIEDWSYVFKPPTMYKYVGSTKYAPLAVLPSQQLPPVTVPPRWQQEAASAKRLNESDAPVNRTAGVKRSASPAVESREASRNRRSLSATPSGAGAATTAGGAGAARGRGGGAAGASPAPRASPAPSAASAASPRANHLAHLAHAAHAAHATHAACPLLLNVLLADTVLNVFRDHNFDSCTLCVCNAGPRVVGNIRGADAATYLHGASGGAAGGASRDSSAPASPAPDDEPSRCTCGFSAIVNRRRAHRAGLFYEDEMEITGLAEEPCGVGARAALAEVAGVVVGGCAALAGGGASALARAAARAAQPPPATELTVNLLEYSDGGVAAARALRAAGGGSGSGPSAGAVHRWPFIGARAPRSSRDVVRLMRRLRPLLQDAIQKRCCGARMWDGVTGPLTWRQFHRLAGRGNEDLCEPQPVPPLLVGHDRDWLALSPYALRHWERLALEPYSYARDVAYVVLAADGDVLTDPLRTFFRELSTAYEACRLGRHQPVQRVARDGLVRVAADGHERGADDDWAGDLPPGRLGEYVRAYADVLRTTLVPALAALPLDRTLLEHERTTAPSPMRPPSTPDHPPTPSGQGGQAEADDGASPSAAPGVSSSAAAWEDDESGAPALVLYLVEPPAAHAHRPQALHALLRLASRIHHHLRHHNPLIQIISLEGVHESWSGGVGAAERRSLAFSVFTGARRLLQHQQNGKSLTGFGTAADSNLFMAAKDEKNRAPYKLFSPAWVLAPPRALKEVAETWGQSCGEQGAVLFLSYCLSHDQRWLLAAATDARGELLDTAAINIHVPARSRRRRCGPARRLGLKKLMDFTLGVMSQAAQPWRLVVGRVGRIGHGELKGWSWLLSRKNLVRASVALRELCASCCAAFPGGAPVLLSACLVSTEPDSCLRLMADRFTPDERFSQASIQSHLHTPRDVTATHILVFPTSATTQSNQMPFEPPMANGEDNDMMFLNVDMGDEDMGEDNISDLLIGDMFSNMWAQGSPRASPRRNDDDPASPAGQPHHAAACPHTDDVHQEQVGTVLQQPLALGYMVSTAPLRGMPAWWWAGCDHLRDACPAFLKNALHLHTGNVHAADDFTSLTQRRDHNSHPLDSQTTTDVLRYVLEGYNALSWLTLDGTTHDRLSCLPMHVQVLMQLYHAAAALG